MALTHSETLCLHVSFMFFLPAEAELEEAWLTEAGLSSLVVGSSSTETPPVVEAVLSTLTRQQAATVRKRLDNYNETLRKRNRQPIRDVRDIFTEVGQEGHQSGVQSTPCSGVQSEPEQVFCFSLRLTLQTTACSRPNSTQSRLHGGTTPQPRPSAAAQTEVLPAHRTRSLWSYFRSQKEDGGQFQHFIKPTNESLSQVTHEVLFVVPVFLQL